MSTGPIQQDMRAEIARLSTPDRVASPFGALEFFDGVPLPDTVRTIYDALDLMRGIDVFLNAMPGASLVAIRAGFARSGSRRRGWSATPTRSPTRAGCC